MEEIGKLIEDLLCYGEKELFLSEEGKVFCRNQLLELLQVEPSVACGNYPENIDTVLTSLADYALQEKIIEEENYAKFCDKLMHFIMPSQDAVLLRYNYLHETEGRKSANGAFFRIVNNSRYIKDTVSRSTGWYVDSGKGELAFIVPAVEKSLEEGFYPKCDKCIENIGFCGMPEEESSYRKRVLPFDLDGEKWYFAYEKEPLFSEEFCVSNAKHTPSGDGRIVARMVDFAEKFCEYFACYSGERKEHDMFYGGKKSMPLFDRPTVDTLVENEDYSVKTVDWFCDAIRVEGSAKAQVIKEASLLIKSWKEYQENNKAVFAVYATETTYTVDIVLAKNEVASAVLPSLADYAYLGMVILPKRTRKALYPLMCELMKDKPDFSAINENDILQPYLEMMIQIAASKGAHLKEDVAKSVLLSAINENCLSVLLSAKPSDEVIHKWQKSIQLFFK